MLCEMEEETLSFAECMQLLEDSFPLDENMQVRHTHTHLNHSRFIWL